MVGLCVCVGDMVAMLGLGLWAFAALNGGPHVVLVCKMLVGTASLLLREADSPTYGMVSEAPLPV